MEKNNKIKYLIGINISNILRNVFGVLRAKATALFLGVAGVGILGQIIVFFDVQKRLSIFGLDAILINRLGKLDFDKDQDSFLRLLSTSFFFLFTLNSIYFIFMLLLVKQLTVWLFNDISFQYLTLSIIFLAPIFAFSYSFEILTQALLDYRRLIIGKNIANIISILSAIPLIYFWGYYGIVFGLFLFIVSGGIYFFIVNINIFKQISLKKVKLDRSIIPLLKIGSTAFTRKASLLISLVLFRIIIVQTIGIDANGYFQSVWSIAFYLNIFIGSFISYYFPLVSRLKSEEQIRKSINENIKYLFYIIFPFITIIMIFPNWLLLILYNREFQIMDYSLQLMAFAKFFEGYYTIMSISFLSQTYLKPFLILDILRNGFLILFSIILMKYYQLFGAVLGVLLMQITSAFIIFIVSYKIQLFKITIETSKTILFLMISTAILFIPNKGNVNYFMLKIILFITFVYYFVDLSVYKNISVVIKNKYIKSR